MSLANDGLRGVVHGKVIQLDSEAGLPDGQEVQVTLRLVQQGSAKGDGFLRSAGAWSDDPEGLDTFLESTRQARKADRPEIAS